MKKNNNSKIRVSFRGKVETSNGENAPIGTCDKLVNLRECDDAIKSVGICCPFTSLGDNDKIIATHRTDNGVNIITTDGKLIKWLGTMTPSGGFTKTDTYIGETDANVNCAETLGDFIIVGTDSGNYYLHLAYGTYTPLHIDDAIPVITLGSAAPIALSEVIPQYSLTGNYQHWQMPLAAADISGYSATVRSAYSRLLDSAHSAGMTVQPTLARYAVRLYDDSYLWVSAPTLIGSGIQGINRIKAEVGNDGDSFTSIAESALTVTAQKLAISIIKGFDASWDRLIKSIDILTTTESTSIKHSQWLDYRCEASSGATRSYYLSYAFKHDDAQGVATSLISSAHWNVACSITDFDALRDGKVIAANVAAHTDGSGGALSLRTFALSLHTSYPLSVGCDTLAACCSSISRRLSATSLLSHNRNLFSCGNSATLISPWNIASMWHNDVTGEACSAVIKTRIKTTSGVAVTVWNGSLPFTPQALNAIVSYPDSRAIDIYISIQSGENVMKLNANLYPIPGTDMSCLISPDLTPTALQVSPQDAIVIPAQENNTESRAGTILQSHNLNPFVTKTCHSVCDAPITAMAASSHHSNNMIGTPLYAFAATGIYALPYRTATASYSPAVVISRLSVNHASRIANSDSSVYFADTAGSLYSISQYRIERVLRECRATHLAYNHTAGELWLILDDGSTEVLMQSLRRYSRTDGCISLFASSATVPLGITGTGGVIDITHEGDWDTPVSLLTMPFSPQFTSLFTPHEVIWNIFGSDIDAHLYVYGEQGVSCHGMKLCHAHIHGNVNAPLPLRFFSPRLRTMRLSIGGTLPPATSLHDAIVVT